MSAQVQVRGGATFCTLLGVSFIVLKLCGVIAWSWIWVLAPLWAGPALVLLLVLGWVFCYVLARRGRRGRRRALVLLLGLALLTLPGCLLAGSMGPSITASTGDEPLVSASLFPKAKGVAGVPEGDDDTAIIRIPDSMTGFVVLAKGTLPAESATTTASRPGILDWLKGSEQTPPPPGGER